MKEFNVLDLLVRCQKRQSDQTHEPYCFELFRRAIDERSEASWSLIYEHYYGIVHSWVRRANPPEQCEVDDLVQEALLSFWKTYTSEKLEQATQLSSVLAYLKSCAKTTVLMAWRSINRRIDPLELDPDLPNASNDNVEEEVSSQLRIEQINALIAQICKSDQDRAIADAFLWRGLNAADTYALYPKLFNDVKEVYSVKRNLWNRLRRNTDLQDFL